MVAGESLQIHLPPHFEARVHLPSLWSQKRLLSNELCLQKHAGLGLLLGKTVGEGVAGTGVGKLVGLAVG